MKSENLELQRISFLESNLIGINKATTFSYVIYISQKLLNIYNFHTQL